MTGDGVTRKRSGGRLVEDLLAGTVLIAVGGVWAMFWGTLVLIGWGFGDGFGYWSVVLAAALALGIYVFFLGIAFLRGAPKRGGIVRFGIIGLVVAVVVLVGAGEVLEDRSAAEVNPVVARQYMKRGTFASVVARCGHVDTNSDGSEYWVCDVETERPWELDVCNVDISRPKTGRITARITYCLNEDLGK